MAGILIILTTKQRDRLINCNLTDDSLKQKREHSFEQTNLSAVLNAVASRNNLIARTAIDIGTTIIDHLDQTNESDLSFIARLGELYDAVATIKSGFLIFMQAGQAKTVNGNGIDKVTIDLNQCEDWRYEKRKAPYTGLKHLGMMRRMPNVTRY